MDYRRLIAQCRDRFGAPGQRTFDREATRALRVRRPGWARGDAIGQCFRHRKDTFARGEVRWGHIVQANSLLFDPGRDDCPGAIVFSDSESVDGRPRRLAKTAHNLFELKGTTPADPTACTLAEQLTDEFARPYGLPVPDALAGDTSTALTTVFLPRHHLPGGYLAQNLLPMVIRPEAPRIAWALPGRYWPASLRYWWLTT